MPLLSFLMNIAQWPTGFLALLKFNVHGRALSESSTASSHGNSDVLSSAGILRLDWIR